MDMWSLVASRISRTRCLVGILLEGAARARILLIRVLLLNWLAELAAQSVCCCDSSCGMNLQALGVPWTTLNSAEDSGHFVPRYPAGSFLDHV